MSYRYSRELDEIVETRETLEADDALYILVRELLGDNYYIVDPVTGPQANAIIVRDILRRYKPKKKRKW